MGEVPEAVKRLTAKLGYGGSEHSPSPEVVPVATLRRNAELIFGGQVGYRISQYGTEGIGYGLNQLAEAWKGTPQGDWLKANEKYVARILTGGSTLAALLLLKGKWSRILAFGAGFEQLTYIFDAVDSYVRTAMKLPPPTHS